MSKTILPDITSTDISSLPDQAAYKINRILRQLRQEIKDREEGEQGGGEALQAEREARIIADEALGDRIDDKVSLILSTTDPGEGFDLPENTLYGVYL